MEALSDGVYGFAITLLVLDLRVPDTQDGGLADALIDMWPAYAAFVTAFAVIGNSWTAHSTLGVALTGTTRALSFLNLVLLLFVVTVPWTTSLVTEYLSDDDNGSVAVAVFAANYALLRLSGLAALTYLDRRPDLLDDGAAKLPLAPVARRTGARVAVGLAAMPIAFLSPHLALALVAAVAVEGLLPPPWARPAAAESAAPRG